MGYTVNQLAQLAHISVRTLHYYDEIGLLKPSSVMKNGYRFYEEKEFIRLQQILFFRELEFTLDDIKRMLNRPNFSVLEALRDQKKLMQLKQTRLTNLVKTIDKTIRAMTKNQKMDKEEMYDAFKDDEVKEYQEEVKARWGSTEAYKQSQTKVNNMTKKEMDKLKEDGKKFTEELAKAMDKPIHSKEVQALIQKHYDSINFFYDCNLTMYGNLARMYVEDPRFKANYDTVKPGLAEYLQKAIQYYTEKHE